MLFLVFENGLKKLLRTIVPEFHSKLNSFVVRFDRIEFGLPIILVLGLNIWTNVHCFQLTDHRSSLKEQDAGNKLFSMFHFGNGARFVCFVQAFVSPIVTHLSMNHVLVNCGQFIGQKIIELFNDFFIASPSPPPFQIE